MSDSLTSAVTSIACIVMAASALLYLPMQIYALVMLRGGWRRFFHWRTWSGW